MDIFLFSWVMGSTKEAVAFEHAAISNMISGLSTRNIEESAREAVLIEPVSNPSTLISMLGSSVSLVPRPRFPTAQQLRMDYITATGLAHRSNFLDPRFWRTNQNFSSL